jgi:uncharacterized membrane protein YoaK (UPF0700 family)
MKLLLSETRVQSTLAIFIAMIAGYVDGYGLLFLGTYVSFTSGNTTLTDLRSVQGNSQAALPSAIAIVFLVLREKHLSAFAYGPGLGASAPTDRHTNR